jgi:fructose-1,6-bisphosphatase/inositol monophosphatase family enzyme
MTAIDIHEHAKTLNDQLSVAIQAATLAGKIIAEGYDQTHEIDAKGVGDLVSEIDHRADRAMTDFLSAESDALIISEELNPNVDSVSDECWIVDPLDASSAFLMRAGKIYPSVLIAKREDGQTACGVVHFPLTGEWFYGVRGLGAWKNGVALQVSSAEMTLREAWVEMNQYGDSALETEVFSTMRKQLRSPSGARLVTSNVPHAGVAMRIAESNSALAAAVHDNRTDDVKQGPWDIAAPVLILLEAGGAAATLKGEEVDPFAGQPFVVARSQSLVDEVLACGCGLKAASPGA